MPQTKAQEAHDDAVVMAAQHHSDLNIFGALVAMLEGGTLYTSQGYTARERLIRICKEQEKRQMKLYDAALRKAGVRCGRGEFLQTESTAVPERI